MKNLKNEYKKKQLVNVNGILILDIILMTVFLIITQNLAYMSTIICLFGWLGCTILADKTILDLMDFIEWQHDLINLQQNLIDSSIEKDKKR